MRHAATLNHGAAVAEVPVVTGDRAVVVGRPPCIEFDDLACAKGSSGRRTNSARWTPRYRYLRYGQDRLLSSGIDVVPSKPHCPAAWLRAQHGEDLEGRPHNVLDVWSARVAADHFSRGRYELAFHVAAGPSGRDSESPLPFGHGNLSRDHLILLDAEHLARWRCGPATSARIRWNSHVKLATEVMRL